MHLIVTMIYSTSHYILTKFLYIHSYNLLIYLFICLLFLQFFIAVSNYTGAGKEDKLKFAFMIFDEDGNGVITKAELLKMLKSNHMASHDAEVARKADTIMVSETINSSLRYL